MKNSRITIALFSLLVIALGLDGREMSNSVQAAGTTESKKMHADKIEITKNEQIAVNGKILTIIRKYDSNPLEVTVETIAGTIGHNPGLYPFVYYDGLPSAESTTRHIIVVDLTGQKLALLNAIATGLDFQWGGNNYVRFINKTMYFGIYEPQRMQFIYRDGKLEVNKGRWRGPARPEKYIEPTGNDPCWNVNGVEDCREEIANEQTKAKKSRK